MASTARTAREATSAMSRLLPPDRRDDLRLLVSEVVTNSIRHRDAGAGDWIRLRMLHEDRRVRVEVSNPGSGISVERAAKEGSLSESGWGLYLLERMADRWGMTSKPDSTCVWFELVA
jgi:anti-sigma regulatory factor (Ser/Thr protein kinase)